MPVDAATVSYVLSSFASVGRILESTLSLLRSGKKITEGEFDALAVRTSEQINKNQNNALGATHLHAAMTKEIVQDLEGKLFKIMDKMRKIVTDPTLTPAQQVKDLASAQKEYCAQLKMIRMLSGGTLPPQLEDEWKNNGCEAFLL